VRGFFFLRGWGNVSEVFALARLRARCFLFEVCLVLRNQIGIIGPLRIEDEWSATQVNRVLARARTSVYGPMAGLAPESVRPVSAGDLCDFVPSFQLGFDELFRLWRCFEIAKLLAAAIMPKHVNMP